MADARTALSVQNASKHFAGVQALADVSVSFRTGSVHCLAGENGSGKSTLIKLISGVVVPDAGSVIVGGHKFQAMTPHIAIQNGIQVIYQDLSLFGNLSIAENIAFGSFIAARRRRFSKAEAMRVASASCERIGAKLPLSALGSETSVATRQLAAICRALGQRVQILFMDEPTTALTKKEVGALFAVVQELRAQGVSIVFVSHKLQEVLSVSDEVTVLRNGRVVAEGAVGDFDPSSLSVAMTGRSVAELERRQTVEPAADEKDRVVAENLCVPGLLRDVTVRLHQNEILGVTGLLGSGRDALAHALFGIHPATSGTITVDGTQTYIDDVPDAIRAGIGYVPGDRLTEGLFLKHTIAQNVVAAGIDTIPRTAGLVLGRSIVAIARKLVAEFRIKATSTFVPAGTLSGGNQQRVVLAKWFTRNLKILILNGPTVGVDVGSKREILSLLRDLRARGAGIIVISDDISELVQVADRVIVMREGRVARELAGADITDAQISAELLV